MAFRLLLLPDNCLAWERKLLRVDGQSLSLKIKDFKMYFSGSARGILLNLYLLDFFKGLRNLLCYKRVKMFRKNHYWWKPGFYWVAAFWCTVAGEDDPALGYGFCLQFLQCYIHASTTQNLCYCFFFKEKHREDTYLPLMTEENNPSANTSFCLLSYTAGASPLDSRF